MVHTIDICHFTIEDVHNSNTIYICDLTIPKVITVRQQTKRVQAEYIEAPYSLQERVGNLTVAANGIFVNGIPFVIIVSRWGQFNNGVIF